MKFADNFELKLCQKLQITPSFATQYNLEYKKFILMAICSKQMLTPSEQVDHVWHLHLSYMGLYHQHM